MTRSGLRRIAIGAAFVFLSSVFLFASYRDLSRGPHLDEVEHLHSSILIVRGLRPYVDFSQHHPPLYWGMLRALVTETEGTAEMQALVTRARLGSASLAALIVVAAAFVVWRASGSSLTALTFVGAMFAAGGVWWNGLGDLRPDTAALASWWIGAACVLTSRRASIRGLGIGLVFLGALIKPQWPLSSIVIGIVFLASVRRDRRSLLAGMAAAAAVALGGLGATALMADLSSVYFHVFTQTSAMVGETFHDGVTRPPLFGCPILLRPPAIYLAMALVLAAWARARASFAKPDLVLALLAIAVASLLEIFFVYPYPVVDFRFYAFWSIAGTSILGLLPQAAAALIPASFGGVRRWIPMSAVILALVAAVDIVGPARAQPDAYWRHAAWLEKQLGPGETVWSGALNRHPIDARDASYYWFGMPDVIPVAIRLASTERGRPFLPPLTESDLPPCRVLNGLDQQVRFMAVPLAVLPVARDCFERLRASGRVVRTPYPQHWLVRR